MMCSGPNLFDLARTAPPTSPDRRQRLPRARTVRASVQRVLDNLAVPAVVFNVPQDLIASNLAGRALYIPHFEAERPNFARFIFLDSRAHDFYADWEQAGSLTAAVLRYEAGRDPMQSYCGLGQVFPVGLLSCSSREPNATGRRPSRTAGGPAPS
jgi:hypothetical protein